VLLVRASDRKLSDMTWGASKCFEAGDFGGAARGYREILGQFPCDNVARAMLATLTAGAAMPQAGPETMN